MACPYNDRRGLILGRGNCGDSSLRPGPGGPGLRSVESHVIPAKAGIQFLPDMDPRLRGGDESLTSISMGGPQARLNSE